MDDMRPIPRGVSIIAAFAMDGYIHAVTETGIQLVRKWDGHRYIWHRESEIPIARTPGQGEPDRNS